MKDDTIYRQDAFDALNGLTKIFLNNLPPTIDRADAVDAIKELPSAQPGWIPCGEKLPERYDNYLITTEDGMVVFGVYDPREKQWCRYDKIKSWWLYGIKVLAWMPLPKPWEGEKDDG